MPTKVFGDFSGGEWGNLGAYRAREDMFSARNMIVYDDGAIGPRSGLKDLAWTGVPNGEVLGFGYMPLASKMWFIVGTSLYLADDSVAVAALAAVGSFTSAPTRWVKHKESTRSVDDFLWIVTDNTGLYKWGGANALTQVDANRSGFDIELYRSRMYITDQNRINYSDDADFATWGSGSFFDVGYEYPGLHLLTWRNSLQILTGEYQWALTGVPESTSTLRRVATATPASNHAALMTRDVIYFIPATRRAPIIYRGGVYDEAVTAHLEWTTGNADVVTCAATIEDNDICFVTGDGSDDGLIRSRGVWTYHDFEVAVKAVTRSSQDRLAFTDRGGAGAAGKFYLMQMDLNRPAFVSDARGSPGDGSSTPFAAHLHLPMLVPPNGNRIRANRVIVDFTSWDTGTTETAHFDVNVVTNYRDDGTTVTSTTQSFDEAVGSSSTTGTDRRAVFNVGDEGWGGGIQVKFSAIRSVSIRQVMVDFSDDKRTGR